MKTRQILLMPDGADGGGAGASGAAGGQGAGSGGAPAGGTGSPAAGAAAPPTTAQKLWGDLVSKPDTGKPADSGTGHAGGQPAGGEASGGAAKPADSGSAGAAAPPAGQAAGPAKIELTQELLEQMGQNIARAVKGPEPEKQMSQEQFDQMFNIYRPNEELLAAVLGEDKPAALAALQTMLHGSAKQATTIASHLLAHEIEQLKQFVQPAIQMAQERQQEAMKVEFFEAHPDLKGLDPLLVLIRDQFVARGTKFKTKEEAFKAVSDEARKQIEAIPGLKLGVANAAANNGNGQGTNQPERRMPALSGGKGQTGAGEQGAASGSKGQKSTAERIFG